MNLQEIFEMAEEIAKQMGIKNSALWADGFMLGVNWANNPDQNLNSNLIENSMFISGIKYHKIFSGNYSEPMWNKINKAESVQDVVKALYLVCCRLQELEHFYDKKLELE